MKKSIIILSYTTICLAFLLLLWFFYTLLWPFQAVKLNVSPAKILTPVVARGEHVEIELNFTKLMELKPEVTYYLVDGEITKLAETGLNRPTGQNVVVSTRTIPKNTLPNTYWIQIDLVYEIVPWRKLYYTWRTEPFEVK